MMSRPGFLSKLLLFFKPLIGDTFLSRLLALNTDKVVFQWSVFDFYLTTVRRSMLMILRRKTWVEMNFIQPSDKWASNTVQTKVKTNEYLQNLH